MRFFAFHLYLLCITFRYLQVSETTVLTTSQASQLNETVQKNDTNSTVWSYYPTGPDYVQLTAPAGSRAAIPSDINTWPKNVHTGTYDIPIDLNGASEATKKRVRYVTGYLSRATRLNFRPFTSGDFGYVKVLEKPNDMCWSTLGKPTGYPVIYMNLHPAVCTTLHMVMHEFLHLLGFMHEHERSTAVYHYTNIRRTNTLEAYGTAFDELSVMAYPYYAIGPTRNPYINEITKHRRTFLTRCDWHLLLTLYPSDNKPPTCIPNYIPNLLVPTPDLQRRYSVEKSKFLCRYANEWLFDAMFCVTPTRTQFPNLSDELGYNAINYLHYTSGSITASPTISISTETQYERMNNLTKATMNEDIYANASSASVNPLNADNYSLNKEFCKDIVNYIKKSTFIEKCGPSSEFICNEVSCLDELRKWMKNYYVSCKRPQNNTQPTTIDMSSVHH